MVTLAFIITRRGRRKATAQLNASGLATSVLEGRRLPKAEKPQRMAGEAVERRHRHNAEL